MKKETNLVRGGLQRSQFNETSKDEDAKKIFPNGWDTKKNPT